MDTNHKLSWKEKYSAVLLLLIGLLYLAVWLISVFSETTGFVKLEGEKISLNKWELLNHIRSVLTFVFGIGGGWLILRKNKTGWVLGSAVLFLFVVICGGAMYNIILQGDKKLTALAGTALLILLTGLVFLLLPGARRRLMISAPVLITGIITSLLLTAFYLLLQ